MRFSPPLALAFSTGFALAAAGSPAIADAPRWEVRDGSSLGFEVLQQGSPVPGAFDSFTVTIDFDPNDLDGSRIVVEVDMASVATGHDDRDTSLRSSDLFHVEAHPTAIFESTRIEAAQDPDAYVAHGALTIREVTREVALPFTLEIEEDGNQLLAEAEGELEILRLDYGVGEGDWAATTIVGNTVTVSFEIEATRPKTGGAGA